MHSLIMNINNISIFLKSYFKMFYQIFYGHIVSSHFIKTHLSEHLASQPCYQNFLIT